MSSPFIGTASFELIKRVELAQSNFASCAQPAANDVVVGEASEIIGQISAVMKEVQNSRKKYNVSAVEDRRLEGEINFLGSWRALESLGCLYPGQEGVGRIVVRNDGRIITKP